MSTFPLSPDGNFGFVLSAVTAEPVGLLRVSTWVDGSAMSPAKADGVSYFRHTSGDYYRRSWSGGRIDMREYLDESGVGDNAARWTSFLTYTRQQNGTYVWPLHFVGGIYFSSQTLRFSGSGPGHGDRLDFSFAGGCVFEANANMLGWDFDGIYGSNFTSTGTLRLRARGTDPADGLVDPTSCPNLQAHIAQNHLPVSITNRDGETLAQKLGKAAGNTFYSLAPADYKWHGLRTSTVLENWKVDIDGFSGIGVYLYGNAIGSKSTPNPDGSVTPVDEQNTSLCSFDYVRAKNCGMGMVSYGADSNNDYVQHLDVRANRSVGFTDLSQSGTHVWGAHGAVNGWGNYHMLSGGHYTLIGKYDEVDDHGYSVYGGAGNILGGPTNSPYIMTDSFTGCFQDGNTTIGLQLNNPALLGDLTFQRPNDTYHQLVLRNRNQQGISLGFSVGGDEATKNFAELVGMGEECATGKLNDGLPRWRYRQGIGIGATDWYAVSGLNPPAVRFYLGDTLPNTNAQPSQPTRWVCRGGGYFGPNTYQSLGGVAIEKDDDHSAGSQTYRSVSPTKMLRYGDVFTVAGTFTGITAPTGLDAQGRTTFVSFVALGNITATFPIYPTALFVAEGPMSGTLAQRPTLQSGGDVGVRYFATDLNGGAWQTWNGSSWLTT